MDRHARRFLVPLFYLGLAAGALAVPEGPRSRLVAEWFDLSAVECADFDRGCLDRARAAGVLQWNQGRELARGFYQVGGTFAGAVVGWGVASIVTAPAGAVLGRVVADTGGAGFLTEEGVRASEEVAGILAACLLVESRFTDPNSARQARVRALASEVLAIDGRFAEASLMHGNVAQSCMLTCEARDEARQGILMGWSRLETLILGQGPSTAGAVPLLTPVPAPVLPATGLLGQASGD